MNFVIIKHKNFVIWTIFIILFTTLTQYFLLKSFQTGFTPDDWSFVFLYKTLGDRSYLRLPEVWRDGGAYTTFFIYYIGVLVDFVGMNYRIIGLINVALKIIATASIFPLVYFITKNKFLAFASTFLYAVSYSSVGSLEFAVKGADYLSIFFINLFLLSYYFLIEKKSFKTKWLPISILFFLLSIIASTIRSYPILVLVPLIEIFIFLKNGNLDNIKRGLIRLFLLYLPFLLLLVYKPAAITSFVLSMSVLQKVIDGNWHLLLTPMQGLGFMFIPLEVWGRMIQPLAFENFYSYLRSLVVGGPFLIWTIVIIILSFITTSYRKKFVFLVGGVNFILQICVYFIAFHSQSIDSGLRVNFDPPRLYSTVNGIFAISLAVGFFRVWFLRKKETIFLIAGSALFIALLFTTLTWALADLNLGYKETSYYLVVASEFFSIFVASILTLFFDKYIKEKRISGLKRYGVGVVLISIVVLIFISNREVINNYFTSINSKGRSYIGQQMIQNRFAEELKDFDYTKPALFYFDATELSLDGPFFSEGFLSVFPFWMHIKNNSLIEGCSEVFYESLSKLKSLVMTKGKDKGILYRSLCVFKNKKEYKEIFYKKENFYAFKIKNRIFINITAEVVKELGL